MLKRSRDENIYSEPLLAPEIVVEPDSEIEISSKSTLRDRQKSWLIKVLSCTTILLGLSNALLVIKLLNKAASECNTTSIYTGLNRTKIDRVGGYSASEYTSTNETEAELAWAQVNLGHGVVALDADYALTSLGLPNSRHWKPDRSKLVYVLAVYHAMHCVAYLHGQIGRRGNGQIISDEHYNHSKHCLDVIRQELMCTADDTPLVAALNENLEVLPLGYQQNRKCTEWVALRDWATARSAGYATAEQRSPGGPKQGVNYPTTDGWIVH